MRSLFPWPGSLSLSPDFPCFGGKSPFRPLAVWGFVPLSGPHRRRAGASRPGYPFLSALTPRSGSDTLPDGEQRPVVDSSPPRFAAAPIQGEQGRGFPLWVALCHEATFFPGSDLSLSPDSPCVGGKSLPRPLAVEGFVPLSGPHRGRAGASRPGYPFISALTPRFASDTLPDGEQRPVVGSSPSPFRRCACPSGSRPPLSPGVTPPGRKNSAPSSSGGIFPGLAVPAAAGKGPQPLAAGKDPQPLAAGKGPRPLAQWALVPWGKSLPRVTPSANPFAKSSPDRYPPASGAPRGLSGFTRTTDEGPRAANFLRAGPSLGTEVTPKKIPAKTDVLAV